MKNRLDSIKKIILHHPTYKSFEAMSDSLLLFFFLTSIIPATYWSRAAVKLYDPYINAFNEAGLTLMGLAVTIVYALIAISAIFFGALAKRTGALLSERIFK